MTEQGRDDFRQQDGVSARGLKLSDATRVGAVRLRVSDVEQSLSFYHELLGMRIIARDSEVAVLGAAGSDVPLLELHGGARGARRGRLGLYHFAVLLPSRRDLGSLLAHLMDKGVHPGAADHLVSEALYLQDPDDLGIEIYRDRPRSEWQSRGGEVAMSTDPLDARGVMEAAEGARWKGMPEGTTIGHVHLHVGDIAHARAFYHEALGFDVMVSGYPGALFMAAGGYHHHLGVNTWAGAHARPPEDNEPHLISWDLVLPDGESVAAAAKRLTDAGFAASPEEAGGSVVRDPWGTALRLTTGL